MNKCIRNCLLFVTVIGIVLFTACSNESKEGFQNKDNKEAYDNSENEINRESGADDTIGENNSLHTEKNDDQSVEETSLNDIPDISSDMTVYLKDNKIYSYSKSTETIKEECDCVFEPELEKKIDPNKNYYINLCSKIISDSTLITPYMLKEAEPDNPFGFNYDLFSRTIGEDGSKIDKIGQNVVWSFYTDDDVTKVAYVDESHHLYLYDLEKNSLLKCDDNHIEEYSVLVSPDCNYITYERNNGDGIIWSLGSNNTEKISDSALFLKVYDTGECFFIEWDDDDIPWLCYFNENKTVLTQIDDLGEIDIADYNASAVFPVNSDETDRKWQVFSNGNLYNIELDDVDVAFVSKNGSKIMLISDIHREMGNLYEVEIDEGKDVLVPKLFDEDVACDESQLLSVKMSIGYINNDDFLYYKNIKDNTADMLINKTFVDYGVCPVFLTQSYDKKNKKYYYLTNVIGGASADYFMGTLKVYDGKGVKKIDDNVLWLYESKNTGDIAYIANYNSSICTGDLYLFTKGEKRLLDKGCSTVISNNGAEIVLNYNQTILLNMIDVNMKIKKLEAGNEIKNAIENADWSAWDD